MIHQNESFKIPWYFLNANHITCLCNTSWRIIIKFTPKLIVYYYIQKHAIVVLIAVSCSLMERYVTQFIGVDIWLL